MWLCSKGKHFVICEVICVKCSYFTYCKNVNNYTTGLAQRPLTEVWLAHTRQMRLFGSMMTDRVDWVKTARGLFSDPCLFRHREGQVRQASSRFPPHGAVENQLWMVRGWVHMWPRMWFPSTGKLASRNLSLRIVKESNNGKRTAHPAWYQGMGMAHCLGL